MTRHPAAHDPPPMTRHPPPMTHHPDHVQEGSRDHDHVQKGSGFDAFLYVIMKRRLSIRDHGIAGPLRCTMCNTGAGRPRADWGTCPFPRPAMNGIVNYLKYEIAFKV